MSVSKALHTLHLISDLYEREKIPPVSAKTGWQYAAKTLGNDGRNITGSNIDRIDRIRGYPVARLRRQSTETLLNMINPFTGAAFVWYGLIVVVDPILPPRGLEHEMFHFYDWAVNPDRFIWWQKYATGVPVIGYLNRNELYAYANQLLFWRKPPNLENPIAIKYHAELCHFWADLSGRYPAQLFGKVTP
jgi:hypothetical protein